MRSILLVCATLLALPACSNDDEDEGFTNVGVVNRGEPADPSAPRPPVVRNDSEPDPDPDAAADAEVDGGVSDGGDATADGGPDPADAGDMAAPDAMPQCTEAADCVLAVQLDTCTACPIGTTQAEIDADANDCLVPFIDENTALFEYEPFECHGPCGQVSPLCEDPIGEVGCTDGRCTP